MVPTRLRVEFEYDNGYGEITAVVALVDYFALSDKFEVEEVEAFTRDGGNPSRATIAATEEQAIEEARLLTRRAVG